MDDNLFEIACHLSNLVDELQKQNQLKAIEVKLLSGKYAMDISAHSAICSDVDAILGESE